MNVLSDFSKRNSVAQTEKAEFVASTKEITKLQ